MFFLIPRKNYHVVKITTDIIHPLEYPTHNSLKGRLRIHQTERHNFLLEGTVPADERSFFFARFIHFHLPVPLEYVDSCEYAAALQLSNVSPTFGRGHRSAFITEFSYL